MPSIGIAFEHSLRRVREDHKDKERGRLAKITQIWDDRGGGRTSDAGTYARDVQKIGRRPAGRRLYSISITIDSANA